MTNRQPATKRSNYHHNNLREEVLKKAVDIIVERDGPTFSIRELATALGVSHTAVYRHFSDKDALIDEIARVGFDELAKRQKQTQAEADKTPLEQFYALLYAYLGFAREFPGHYTLMFNARPTTGRNALKREVYDTEALDTLISAIKTCQASGDFIPGDVYRMASYTVLAPHGLACYYLQGLFPTFFTMSSAGTDSTRWLADLIVQPLLAKPRSPDEMARLFGSETKVNSDMLISPLEKTK